jgi:hypothetical protein
MQVLFSMILLIGCIGVVEIAQLFQEGDERIRQMIGFDNAVIRTGDELLRFKSELERVAQNIRQWEEKHHLLHVCKNCEVADKAQEVVLEQMVSGAVIDLGNQWGKLVQAVQVEGEALGARGLKLEPHEVPLEKAKCLVCGGSFRLQFPRQICVLVTVILPRTSACVCTFEQDYTVILNASVLGCLGQ